MRIAKTPGHRLLVSIVSILSLLMLTAAVPVHAVARYVSITDLQKEAQAGWHETYKAYGRTVVIDIDSLEIPDTGRAPVLTVTPADAVPPELLSGFKVQANEMNILSCLRGNGYPINSFYNGTKMRVMRGKDFTSENMAWDYRADGNPLIASEAMEVVLHEVERLYGKAVSEALMIETFQTDGKVYQFNTKTGEYGDVINHPDNMGCYTIRLNQSFYGIPVLWHGGGEFSYVKGYKEASMTSCVSGYIYASDSYGIGCNIVNEQAVKYEDIPLLPFSEIKSVLEKLIEDGRVRGIERIRLGYLLYHDPKDDSVNWAVPTWVCRAEYYDDKKQEPHVDRTLVGKEPALIPQKANIFIQAQHGLFLDPLDKSKTRRNVLDIITWEKVSK